MGSTGRGNAKGSDWPRWARHWDPHPMCWLASVLRNRPYDHRGLGMRTSEAQGGVAVTLPNTNLVLGAGAVDQHHVQWSVYTHDPVNPDEHERIVFGEFTWTSIRADRYEEKSRVLRLADGTVLNVPGGCPGGADRIRIESRAQPGRLIPATDTWADLAAIERIAERVHEWLSSAHLESTPQNGAVTPNGSPAPNSSS